MEIVQNQIDIPRLTLKTVKQDLEKQCSRRIVLRHSHLDEFLSQLWKIPKTPAEAAPEDTALIRQHVQAEYKRRAPKSL